MMLNTQYESQSPRRGRKFLAYLLSFVTLMQPVLPSIAAVLPDEVIEEAVNSQPQFIPSGTSASQLKTPAFIEWSTPVASSIKSFRQVLFESHRGALGDPTFVPIATGDITTIIPIFPRHKYIGTEAVQSRYIRTQIQALIGRHLIDSSNTAYRNEASQLNTLYTNALTYSRANPSIKFGDRLELAQDSSGLEADLVWPELRHINGEDVLVPIVYLKESTVNDRKVISNEEELAETTSFGTLEVRNASISASRTRFLDVAGDLELRNASIQSDADLKIVAGGAFDNISSVVSAKNNLVIGAHSINNRTIVYRYDTGHEQGSRYGEIAALASSEGDVILRSYGDITFAGADATASQGEMKLMADGSIFIGAQELYSGSESRYGSGTQTRSAISYLQSHLSASETIQLVANGQIVIDAAEITSENGHIELLAGMGVSVLDRLGQEQSQATGKFGKTSVEESIYQTVAIRSLLDAGKGVKLSTDFGDITLKAADISSTEGTSVHAKNGSVNLLMTTETDHYSYSSVKKGLFTTQTVNKGRNIETGVPNSIVGGFSVEALNGISVEYEGDPALSLGLQLDQISGMEGMSWVNDVRNHPSVDWNAVALAQEQWYDKNTSISPAFAALITIAVAIATSGAGTAFAGVLGAAEGGAIAAAVSAGTSAFISQATLAAANGAVNGDMAGAFDDFTSNDTLKTLAIAMVTAGAIAKVDAAFFNADTTAIDGAQSAVDGAATTGQAQAGVDAALSGAETASRGLSLSAQAAQVVTHAAVSSTVEWAINGGDYESLRDSFTSSLLTQSVNTIGRHMAREIGELHKSGDIHNAVRYIAHAGAGCIVGAAKADIASGSGSSGCSVGAAGAVTGEIIADVSKSATEVGQDAQKIEGFLQKHGIRDVSNLTPEQRLELYNLDITATAHELASFSTNTVDLARLGGALSAFIAGAEAHEVDIAAYTGQTAAEENALFLIPVAIFALKAIDLAITINELKGVYDAFQVSEEEGRKKLLEWGGEAAVAKIAEKALPGATSFKAFIKWMGSADVIPEKLVRKVTNETNKLKDLDLDDPVVPAARGNVSCKKGAEKACIVDLDGAHELSLKAKILDLKKRAADMRAAGDYSKTELDALYKELGSATEVLTDAVIKRNNWSVVPGGKLKGDNGIDHIAVVKTDLGETMVVVVDSKQINNSGFKLSDTAYGPQLSDTWIRRKRDLMDNNSEAYDLLDDALENGTLRKAVAGIDAVDKEFKITPVKFEVDQ